MGTRLTGHTHLDGVAFLATWVVLLPAFALPGPPVGPGVGVRR